MSPTRTAVRKSAKPAAKSAPKKSAKPVAKSTKLGALPEWNLADLYPAIDSPKVKRDLDRADADSIAFEESYKGKLAGLTAEGRLVDAIKDYEALDDRIGRPISY